MKRIKKVIAFALMTVMMMAMSMTAFAAESADALTKVATKTTESTIEVTNISTRGESEVSLYQIAKVDFAKNTVTVNDWAKDVYKADTTDFKAVDAAAANASVYGTPVKTTTGTASFTVDAGVYLVKIANQKVSYNPMIARAYGVTAEGVYSGLNEAYKLIAKGSTTNIEKTVEESYKFVKAGTEVPFTINTNIPYKAKSFVVVDQPTNLTLSDATITIAGVDGTITKSWIASADGKEFSIDLSDYVSYDNAAVTITYTGIVGKAIESAENGYSYMNSAYTNVDGEKKTPTPPVIGYTGTIIVNKTKEDKTPLEGAEFNLKNANGDVVKFVVNDKNEYVYSEAADAKETLVTNKDGKITVTGLAEGEYTLVETKAPENYTVDPTEYKLTITRYDNKNCVVEQDVIDPDLIRLPFTGGMGTTIFTVLGVAIMAMAAALYFATKKNNVK